MQWRVVLPRPLRMFISSLRSPEVQVMKINWVKNITFGFLSRASNGLKEIFG